MSELSRLKWLCRRGTKELDLVMTHYLENHYNAASAEEQESFRELLQLEDPILYDLIIGNRPCADAAQQALVQTLRQRSA